MQALTAGVARAHVQRHLERELRDADLAREFSAWLGGAARSPAERVDATARALEVLSRERPVVLVLDDAHRGHEAARLVDHLLPERGARRLPVLVVAVVQPGVDPGWDARARHVDATHVELGPLEADAQREGWARCSRWSPGP